jgi:hypothetical protein
MSFSEEKDSRAFARRIIIGEVLTVLCNSIVLSVFISIPWFYIVHKSSSTGLVYWTITSFVMLTGGICIQIFK